MSSDQCELVLSTVYPEIVEGLPFFTMVREAKGQPFDKLTADGVKIKFKCRWYKTWAGKRGRIT